MKKNIIALAVVSAFAAPVAMAAAPTVYGSINMSIDNKTDKGTTVSSNNSRLGVKGSSDLGNGLKAIYKVEFGIDVSTTASSGLTKGRNAYLGLAGGFGAVLLGRSDTPMKMSQPTDTFNDGAGDLKPMAGGLGVLGKAGEVRASKVIAYVSPSFGGVKFVAAGVSASKPAKNASLFNVYSIAAMYGSKKKGLYLAGAYNSWSKDALNTAVIPTLGSPTTSSASEYRLSAQYSVAGLMANVIYQNFDVTGGKVMYPGLAVDGTNIQANLAYTMGKLTPKAKYSTVSYDAVTSDASSYALGVDYAMGKKTTAYLEYVVLDKNNLDTKNSTATAPVPLGKDKTTVSLGLNHKF